MDGHRPLRRDRFRPSLWFSAKHVIVDVTPMHTSAWRASAQIVPMIAPTITNPK